MKEKIKKLKISEEIKKINIFNPIDWYYLLLKIRFIHFFIIGGTGVLLNLLFTVTFTELVFGRKNYFYAYLIGLSVNLLYNFTLHTIITFKTKKRHLVRFFMFILYNLSMSALQAFLIKKIVEIVGVNYYILVIICVIGFFFVINFLVSKFLLFNEKEDF